MPLPNSMRYIAMREPGPPDVLVMADGPLPQLKAGEVLIEVAYAGVNRPDCLQRAGAYPPPADDTANQCRSAQLFCGLVHVSA